MTFVFRQKYGDFINSSGAVKIGNNIVFGRDVTILKGVSIGDNSIVALGAVITKSMPPNSVIAGAPAKVICSLQDYYEKRKVKSYQEAVDYGLSILESGRTPKLEDFTEEWVHFITKEEYENNPLIRQHIDFRIKDKHVLEDLLSREKPFRSYDDFLRELLAQHNSKSQNSKK